jgi:hypothetical protein
MEDKPKEIEKSATWLRQDIESALAMLTKCKEKDRRARIMALVDKHAKKCLDEYRAKEGDCNKECCPNWEDCTL